MKSLLQCTTRLSSQPLMHTRTGLSARHLKTHLRYTSATSTIFITNRSQVRTSFIKSYQYFTWLNIWRHINRIILHVWYLGVCMLVRVYAVWKGMHACVCDNRHDCQVSSVTLSVVSHWNSILIRLGWPTREPWRSPGKHFPYWEISPNSNITVFILHPNPHNSPLTS